MPSRSEIPKIYATGAQLMPAIHQAQDWPYEVPHILYEAYIWPPHDIGGQAYAPEVFEEKEDEEWENNTYITCEVLGQKGVWNSEERRRRADNDVGLSLYYGFPYNARWIWAAARTLVDKDIVSLLDLQKKIGEVRARYDMRARYEMRARNNNRTAKTKTEKTPETKAPWDGTGETLPARFKIGDRVRVKDVPAMFYTRTQMYVRGVSGTIARLNYPDLLPVDEAWNRYHAPQEQYYIVRFRQKDLWAEYPFENDTLQSEYPDSWLEPA
jgi:hypothetical protein